jgi:hypothetical protein
MSLTDDVTNKAKETSFLIGGLLFNNFFGVEKLVMTMENAWPEKIFGLWTCCNQRA